MLWKNVHLKVIFFHRFLRSLLVFDTWYFIYKQPANTCTLKLNSCIYALHLNHIMRKPVYVICEQQRCRSGCTSPQPAHLRRLIGTFVVRCLDSIIPLLAIAKISRP